MEKKIYENGIKFQCQGSSNCCVSRGNYGFVFLSKKDLSRISKYFNISLNKFIKIYCHISNGFFHLKEIRKNGGCIFLENKRCTIYKARPTQCRTWPFWPENMNSKKWNKEILNICPGIGEGEIIKKKRIDRLLKIDETNDKEIYRE